MKNLDKIKDTLKEYGFDEKEENHFVHENVSYNTININGKVIKKEVKNSVELVYTGSGGVVDDSDSCMDDMFFFDLLVNGEFQITIGAYTFKEIAETLEIKWEEE